MRAPERLDLDEWAEDAISGYDRQNPAGSYGTLIDELFRTPVERQQEIERLCECRTPSFGYAILAQLVAMEGGRFNVVLTTNFDDLVSDALYLYTEARPLVIHHDALANFIRPTRVRPLVVKLHGDHRLSPRNTHLETSALEDAVKRQTSMLVNDRGLIFIGYGGADVGILNWLESLPPGALSYGTYWVHPTEPSGEIRRWLLARNGVWVRDGVFDEVMLLIREVFAMRHPVRDRFDRIFLAYHEEFLKLSEAVGRRAPDEPGVPALRTALDEAETSLPEFWKVVTQARRLEKVDVDGANDAYRNGVASFPSAVPLLGSYALFLKNVRHDYDAAETMFKRALEADPTHALTIGNYASFLSRVRHDADAAEEMYRRALKVEPTHPGILANFAVFLWNTRRDADAAEAMYKQAVAATPASSGVLANYAGFLSQVRNDYDAAETLFKRALEADPTDVVALMNYAAILKDVRHDYDAAETMFKRALEADPTHARALRSYASFLWAVRKDTDAALAMLKRATEVDPALSVSSGAAAQSPSAECPQGRDQP